MKALDSVDNAPQEVLSSLWPKQVTKRNYRLSASPSATILRVV